MFGRSSTVAPSLSPVATEDGRTAAVSILPGVPLPAGLVPQAFEPEVPEVEAQVEPEAEVESAFAPAELVTVGAPNEDAFAPTAPPAYSTMPPPVVPSTPAEAPVARLLDEPAEVEAATAVEATPAYLTMPPPVVAPAPVEEAVAAAPPAPAPAPAYSTMPPPFVPAVTAPPAYSAPPVYTPPVYAPTSYASPSELDGPVAAREPDAAPALADDDPFLHAVPVLADTSVSEPVQPVVDEPVAEVTAAPAAPKRTLSAVFGSLLRRPAAQPVDERDADPFAPPLPASPAGVAQADLPAPVGLVAYDLPAPVATTFVTESAAVDVVPGVPVAGTPVVTPLVPATSFAPVAAVDEPAVIATPDQVAVPAFGHLVPNQQMSFPAAMEAAAAQIAAQVADEHAEAASTVVEVAAEDASVGTPAPPTVGLVFADGSHTELGEGPEGAALQHVASVLAGDGDAAPVEAPGTPNE